MKIGYARVSSTGQNLETQVQKLRAAGCDKIFEEKKSGASKSERTELKSAIAFIREGDQFVVTRLDRLARSVLDLTQITRDIAAKQVDLIVLDQSIDTTSPTGRLLFHVLASIGEFERELIKERAAEGIARAKAAGVKFGARSKLSSAEIAELKAAYQKPTENRKDLAARFGISRASVYRICSENVRSTVGQWSDKAYT